MEYLENKLKAEARKDKIKFFVFVIICFSVTAVMGFIIISNIEIGNVLSNEINQNDSCANLSLEETSNCLVKELKEFYNYNISNLHLYWNKGFPNIKNWTKIKQEGGVCWHYSEWYVKRAEELGFRGKRVRVDYEPTDHAIALLTNNKNEYCIIDQRNLVGCGKTAITEVDDEN